MLGEGTYFSVEIGTSVSIGSVGGGVRNPLMQMQTVESVLSLGNLKTITKWTKIRRLFIFIKHRKF